MTAVDDPLTESIPDAPERRPEALRTRFRLVLPTRSSTSTSATRSEGEVVTDAATQRQPPQT
jgi:hypothetical protein